MSSDHQNGNGTATAKRTEQRLRASELSYRRLFEAAQDGILILDVETGRIDDVNPFLAKLLGFTHDEMVGHTVGELSPFRDIESNKAMLEQLQQHGYVRYEDLPLKTRDGRHIAVEFVSNVYAAGDKKVIQCNVRDITERKRNQEVLRDSAATQSSILNALPANIALIDKQGVILSVNERWRQFALANALKASHLGVGQNYFEVCDNAIGNWSEKAQEVSLGIHRVLDGETDVFTMEYPCHSPSVQRWFLLRVVPVREGSAEGAVIMHVDITERKLAELALDFE
jgi:PAS domain S-box-containing protein